MENAAQNWEIAKRASSEQRFLNDETEKIGHWKLRACTFLSHDGLLVRAVAGYLGCLSGVKLMK